MAEMLVILVITGGIAVAATTGPLAEATSCFAARTMVLLESGGGEVCQEPVRETFLPVPRPSGPYTLTPTPSP